VVFWQADAEDRPEMLTDAYGKVFTGANMKKELDFHGSELVFRFLARPELPEGLVQELQVERRLESGDSVTSALGTALREAVRKDAAEFEGLPGWSFYQVTWTHRHYVGDSEYIPFDPDEEARGLNPGVPFARDRQGDHPLG
jgi:type I restriction enzyme M protein